MCPSASLTYRGQSVLFPQTHTVQSLQRRVRQEQLSLSNRLRSIFDDHTFLAGLLPQYPPFPLLANLRCGAWYVRPSSSPSSAVLPHPSTCYFKSSDSHALHWTFSLQRCNWAVLELVGECGGAVVVDSTRQGKRFPDSFSRTIPIWCCIVNRAMRRVRESSTLPSSEQAEGAPEVREEATEEEEEWDDELHTPDWVSDSEKQQILQRVDEWVDSFLQSGLDLARLSSLLRCPLRPLWIDRSTPLPHPSQHLFLPFYPLFLVNPSPSTSPLAPRHGWSYVQGAGDDDANWSRGLTPALFWRHAEELVELGPLECEERVDELVKEEKGNDEGKEGSEFEVRGTGLVMGWSATPPTSDSLAERPRLHLHTVHDKAHSAALKRERRNEDGAELTESSLAPPASFPSSLTLPVSGLIKDRRSLLDVLTPALAFILHHRRRQPSLLITGNDWTSVTTVVIAAVLRGWNVSWQWIGEGGGEAMEERVSKALIRQVSLLVHACLTDVFVTRLQLKQLNEYFLSPSSEPTHLPTPDRGCVANRR